MSSSMPTLYFFRKTLALVLSKYSTNSLHSPCLLPLPKRHTFHRIFTILPNVHLFSLFEVHILKDARLPHISMDLLQGRNVA
jgi:hypothetical protein